MTGVNTRMVRARMRGGGGGGVGGGGEEESGRVWKD